MVISNPHIEKCGVRYCRNLATLTYLGRPICDACWTRWADDKQELWRRLGLSEPGAQEHARQPEI